MSATSGGGRSTFLLEVALDRARLKQRLAETLIDERTRRGRGDARQFPQPQMADLLGYSLRQYQRLENPDDPNLPTWSGIEAIAERLSIDAADLFASAETPDTPLTDAAESAPDEALLRRLVAEEVATALEATNALLARLLDQAPPGFQANDHEGR